MRFLFLIGVALLCLPDSINAQNFQLERTFNGHQAPVSYVTFRSEDNLLISGDEKGDIIVWDAMTGRAKNHLRQHTNKITHIEFSNTGKLFSSVSYDGTVKVWRLDRMKVVKTFRNTKTTAYDRVAGNEPTFAAFSGDDKEIYFGGYNLQILKGNIRSGKTSRIYQNNEYGITSGMLSPDKKHLVFAAGGSIYFMNLRTNRIVKHLYKSDEYDDYVCELAFKPNSEILTAWAVNGMMYFWNWQNQSMAYSLKATDREGSSDMAFSEDGQFLVTGNDGSNTRLWNTTKNQVIQLLGEHRSAVVTFAFSMDGNKIVTGSKDNTVRLWHKPVDKPLVENVPRIPRKMKGRDVEVQKTIKVKNRNLELLFWDNRKIDGDTISVNVNGKWVLNNHFINETQQSVQVTFNETNNLVIVHAHNEGYIPPNTIAMIVKDGDKEHSFTLKATLGTSAALRIEVLDE